MSNENIVIVIVIVTISIVKKCGSASRPLRIIGFVELCKPRLKCSLGSLARLSTLS